MLLCITCKHSTGIDYQPGDPEYLEDFEDDDDAEEVEEDDAELETLRLIAAKEAELEQSALAERMAQELILSSALTEKAERDEEQRAENEFVNAERKRVDQIKREREAERQRIEAEEEEEEEEAQRQIAIAICEERARREVEREEEERREQQRKRADEAKEIEEKAREDEDRRLTETQIDVEVDELTAEKARKAELQRLKREAFLKDMNAFSQSIEEEARKASTGGVVDNHYVDIFGSALAPQTVTNSLSTTTVNPFDDDEPPLEFNHTSPPAKKEKGSVRFSDNDEDDGDGPGSFRELTSSLFAANANNTPTTNEKETGENRKIRDNNENIWGESDDYTRISRASNLAASQPSNQNKRDNGNNNYHNNHNSNNNGRNDVSQEDEEEEGSGVASSISNILTKDERKFLSVQQKVAWKALQADLTTRRKGNLVF